jgi:hypothetical protein
LISRARKRPSLRNDCDVLTNVLSSDEALVLLAGQHAEGVGTKVVALALDKVGWENVTPVTIKEGQGSGKGWDRDTPESSLSNNTPPSGLCLVNGYNSVSTTSPENSIILTVLEKVVKEQTLQFWVLLIGYGDVVQEHTLLLISTRHLVQ